MSGRPQANFRPRGGAVRGPGRTGPFPSPFYVPRSPNPNFQIPNFQSPSSFPRQRFVTREMVEAAVAKAQRDLVSSGENISVWKVSQSAALALKVSSWDSLGFRFNDIPYLRELQFVEGKVNAFIHCFVSVRRMTSVHELGLEICKGEGVEEFGDLGLGPLLAHPLVRHYFLVPSDLKEVCSITIDDLVQSLSTFLYRFKSKEFTVEEFLDYLMRKYSVASRDNLGVRIQSMGLYIKFIKGARRAESAALKSIQERQTYPAPEHLSNLPFLFKDYLGEITQEVGSSDAGNIGAAFIKCCQCCPAQKKKGKKHGGCKCNGSPFVDELKLIGIKLSMFNCESSGKLSTGIEEKLESYGAAAYEITKINSSKANQLILSAKQVDSFIATWKGACQKHSADEVLSMMLNVYRCSDKQKRKMQMLFFEYPAVALLNMAVRFLGGESLDVLDRAFDMDSSVYQTSSLYANQPKSESSSDMDAISEDENSIGNAEKNVTLEDIYKQIGCYFKIELNPRRKDLSMEKQLVLRDCERWLTGQFLVEKFEVLGHGNFLDFLEKHLSVLPSQVNDLLNGIIGRQPSIPIFMSQQQSLVVFSQAARNFGKNNELTDKHISMILRKQFPVIALSLENGESIEGLGLADSQSLSNVSSSVAFSVSLLGDCCGKNSLLFDNKIQSDLPEMNYGRGELTSLLGSVSTEDALKCLLRAPMLSDLMLWSHWDLIFGPSLGPLLDWLIDFGCIKELSCIVTSEARIIRVDHSATINGFFEVLAQGSAFNTAVMFLSLFHVFGGSKSIPVSLLRRYAQCGIDSIIKNCMNNLHGNADETLSVHKGSVLGKNRCLFFNDTRTVRCSPSTPPGNDKRIIIYEELSAVNSAYTIVSLFILDCLGYLPSEFRSFAAEILVSAFHFFTRDAAAVILNECRGSDECIMLHGIGLTLGIVEWIEDFKKYSSATSVDTYEPLITRSRILKQCSIEDKNFQGISRNDLLKNDDIEELQVIPAAVTDSRIYSVLGVDKSDTKLSSDKSHTIYGYAISGDHDTQDATIFIETIRREEFGLDSNLGTSEKSLLKKQHARLGRALHCLSHELYSQDSHFILELVQNADDNNYHQDVEPTLIFILNASGIVVMNNELGFSDRNIRALCDIGNSTKKGSSGGYIGHKGIGFKSVFRITDAPEIHSNGFHVKFDITEGQIGFVLPTNIPPCDANFYKKNVLDDSDQVDSTCWKTCIVLPFKSNFKQGKGIGSIISMFSDLHPSLLLFLQRLKCIVFKNMLYDKLITMRRETLEDGMVMVSQGEEKMKWLVVHMSLHAFLVRPDVQTTKIAMAFTIEQTDNGECSFLLDQQPVFAFLPLKNYGLKFIVQGDFILPSSREEVNEDSAWNQWLLSEMPDLFLSAEKSFCALSCFKDNPANAVNCFMSFVPLIGEVHGFFSPLPQMILSKLRSTNCLLLEASALEWVPPCRVLRNWDDNLRMFLSGDLLQQHLGLSYLNKDIILSDPLARALGIQDYGPKILIRILSSICEGKCIKELGLQWLASWLIAFFATLPVSSSGYLTSAHAHLESDLFNNLRKIPFIPLSDGSYCSMEKGQIWFPFNKFDTGSEGENILMNLPGLYAELRTVISCLFTIESMFVNLESSADTIIKVLHKIGVQKLSSHNVVKNHILQSIYDEKTVNKEPDLMIEYLIFIMHHFQSSCFECKAEREGMLQKLQKTKILFTNNGYICPVAEPIYFSLEFGNVFNIKKLLDGTNIKLNEIDTIYLKHPCSQLLHLGLIKWREFFKSLCVTDFVQVNQVKKNFSDLKNVRCHDDASPGELFVNDWESPELVSLLSFLSSNKCLEKSKYLLEVLDKMWDDHFSTKARCYNNSLVDDQRYSFPSSFMKCITEFQWVSCSLDEEIHYPRDLFYDCEQVRSLFGMVAPYAAPQVTSKRFVEDLGFKVTVTLNDAFQVLQIWRNSEAPLASISQMSNFYTFIRDELAKLEGSIIPEFRKDIAMFIPSVYNPNFMSIESGVFMLPHQLYWHDTTGCLVHIREAHNTHFFASETKCIQCITLDIVYPELHDFLVADCGVLENPSFFHYLEILLHLSSIALPSDVALLVFKVFLKWSDDFNSGLARNEDMLRLKNCLLKSEITVLPTEDKWVSLHPRFGLVCWSDNEKLIDEYVQLNSVKFLYFGELTEIEKEMLSVKVAPFLKAIGIPMLAEVISREAIFYGIADSTKEASLINWILPYVQRYLYKLHFNIYCDLKESGLHQITQLEVLVVEKLFYRNTLQGNSGTNQTRHECKSLLQLNRLYITRHADTHSMFLELSRLFFNGAPNIQMANFLHIITKELDFTEEQIESFIVNNFNVPKLAEGEPIWSLVKSPKLNYDEMSSVLHAFPRGKQQRLKPSRKPLSKLNWPPAHTEPASNLHYTNFDPRITKIREVKPGTIFSAEEDKPNPSVADKNTLISLDGAETSLYASTDILLAAKDDTSSSDDQPTSVVELHNETYLSEFSNRDRLFLEAPEDGQSYSTGRLGELVAYKYFCEKLGQASVKWVNEKYEMGYPYDLIIEEELSARFVEVKATTSATKDWFSISANEWHCAEEKGESYSIAWVILPSPEVAQVHVLNNPLKLCQQKLVQLVLLLPNLDLCFKV